VCSPNLIHPKCGEFADDVRDGKFVLPTGCRMPLHDAAEAHVLGEKGGIGKILPLMPNSQDGFLHGELSDTEIDALSCLGLDWRAGLICIAPPGQPG
jgi:hypothetical protein